MKMTESAAAKSEGKIPLEKNRAVRRTIPRLDDDIVRRPRAGTKPKKYTPRRMKNKVNEYFEHCEVDDRIPSIKGLMVFMKMYRSQWYVYIKDPIYSDLMEQTKLIISAWAEEDVYNTAGPAAGKIAYMKNVEGWSDKLETKNQTEVKQVGNVEEARKIIDQLAPKLLEVLKSPEVLRQLGQEQVTDAEFVQEAE
jgi:hypothetical protein